MTLTDTLASHGLHMVDDHGLHLVIVSEGQDVPDELTNDTRAATPYIEADIQEPHGVTFYNTDQAHTDITFSTQDYPSTLEFCAALAHQILTANYWFLPAPQRAALQRSWA